MIFSPTPQKRPRLQLQISERRLLLMLGDMVSVVASVFIALFIWSIVGKVSFDWAFILPQSNWFIVLTVLWFVLASASDFYNLAVAANRMQTFQRLIIINLQLIVVYILIFFISDRAALPRLFIFYHGIASFVLISLWRLVNPALIGWASSTRRVLVIGTDWTAQTIIQTLREEAPHTYEVLGVIGTPDQVGQSIEQVPIVGTGKDISAWVLRENIAELIVTSTRELSGDVFVGLMDAYEHGVTITPMPILYERVTDRVPVEHVGGDWAVVLPIAGTSILNPYPIFKRGLDISLSLIGLFVFGLMLPIIAIAIYLDSPGNIFFAQKRVGQNGRIFTIYKLRSMIPDAEKMTGAVFASANDNRVTRSGRFMRRTRLDEIPQLWNVLMGDMSMIGPRPERPEHVQRLQEKIPFYRTRHIIPPGLTGWAQVCYKYGATDEDALVKLQYDLYYIRHQSVFLDLNILLRTVGKVLRMAGQ